MSEKIYAKGLFGFQKKDNQPDFVIGSMVITFSQLKEFVNTNQHLLSTYNGEQQIKLQLLKGNEGRINFVVDTYKPEPKPQQQPSPAQSFTNTQTNVDSDLPF
jgi:alpha-galactosidase